MRGARDLVVPLLAVIAFVVVAATGVLAAGQGAAPAPASQQWPGQCVADADTMRRNHMDLLKHQRDDTVHQAARPAGRGLNDCLTCHAVKGKDGHPVTVADSSHFCASCHEKAAVRIDCFQCHTSVPGEKK